MDPSPTPSSAPPPADFRARLTEASTETLGRLTDLTHSLADQAARLADESRQLVRERPAPTLGSAFGAGLALGVVFGLR